MHDTIHGMSRVFSLLCCAAAVFLLAGCPKKQVAGPPKIDAYKDATPPEEFEDLYPETIEPPKGTEYPCRLKALPEELDGLPGQDHRYINHVYSQVVIIARSNLNALLHMGKRTQEGAFADYESTTADALQLIEAEDVPRGLESFHADLVRAIELQRAYFKKAATLYDARLRPQFEAKAGETTIERERDAAAREVEKLIEATAASAKLTGAWNKMVQRYEGHWPKHISESIYLHLRAMDL